MGKKTTKDEEPVADGIVMADSAVFAADQSGTRRSAWLSSPLIVQHEIRFKNPMGHNVSVKAEIRRQGDRGGMRCVVGRNDDKSPVGIGRMFFFEDIPAVVEALIGVYTKGSPIYVDMESARLKQLIADEMVRIEETINSDPNDWRNRLLQLKKKLREDMDAHPAVCDDQVRREE